MDALGKSNIEKAPQPYTFSKGRKTAMGNENRVELRTRKGAVGARGGILAGLIALAIAVTPTIVETISKTVTETANAKEATAAALRNQKAPIYLEMLAAANQYGQVMTVRYQCEHKPVSECAITDDELEEARLRFVNAEGAVFMFGSAEAASRVSEIRQANLLPNLTSTGKPTLTEVDVEKLNGAVRNFELAVCKETRADGCAPRD